MDKLAILGFSEMMEISEFLSNKTLLKGVHPIVFVSNIFPKSSQF